SVSATLASDLVTVSVVPSGVVQPRQEHSAAFTPNGRRLVPLGRMFLIPNVDYDVTVRCSSASAVRRVWFLPRPTVVTFGVATWRSALLETVRESGYRRTRGQPAAQVGQFLAVSGQVVSVPWLALRVTPVPITSTPPKALWAALPDGTGLVTSYNNTATAQTHPDVPTAMIWSPGPLAYLGETVPAGTTVAAQVFLYNTSTSAQNATVSLYEANTARASQSITVPAGQLKRVTVSYTPSASAGRLNVRLSAPASVVATVLWMVGPNFGAAGASADLGQVYDGASWRDPVFRTWSALFPGIDDTLAAFDDSAYWGFDSANQAHGWSAGSSGGWWTDYGFYVGAGRTVRAQAWVSGSGSARLRHIGGVLASTSSTTPVTVSFATSAPVTVYFEIVPTSGAPTGYFRYLSIADTSGPNARTQPVPLYGSSALTLSGPPAASWAVAFRVALRSDYTGEVARIPLASGSPLIVTVSSTAIAVTRDSTTLASVTKPTTPATVLVGYSGWTLVLRAGQPGSWNSASASLSLPDASGGLTVSGTNGQGCAALRWAGYVQNPSSAFLAGTPAALGANDSAYPAFASEGAFRYWNADDPNVLVTEANDIVDGVQRGALALDGPGTLIVFPVSDTVEQAIWERPFLLDVIAFPRR
ncbi:MAG: hypothetical protein NZ562_07565, partial [Thermomicrobium sp.]|nr:hypothetical protein [Thermomicrobium sp.]